MPGVWLPGRDGDCHRTVAQLQAIEANGMVFVSGQLPIDAATGKMAEGIEEQARQSLENIKHSWHTALPVANVSYRYLSHLFW